MDENEQIESLLARWQASLDLHAKYAALDEARYWHVQPWPKHERPQRWIIQLARKRILALQRLTTQRRAEGDRAFIEGLEIMSFLATLVGLTSVERFIPLATPENERRDVLAARPGPAADGPRAKESTSKTAENRRLAESNAKTVESRKLVEPASKTGEHRRGAEATRQMPQLPNSRVYRMLAAQRAGVPPEAEKSPKREVKRDPNRPATIKPKKPPAGVTQVEHVVIADAVRLLGWGRQWHELADMIARLSERPPAAEIRRILRTFRAQIEAVVNLRAE